MNINEYQQKIVEISKNYSIHGTENALPVYILGLAGESGEVCELIKRYYRGDNQPNLKHDLTKELGDVLAYLALVSHVFDIDLEEVIKANLEKLESRKQSGNLQGKGSDR